MKVSEIVEYLNGNLIGNGEIEISSVANLKNASKGQISFVEKQENLVETNADCLLVSENFDAEVSCPLIKVKNPKLSFAKIAEILHPPKKREKIIHPSAVIAENAVLGKNLFVGAFVCIGENSEIGDETQIRAGAKVGDNVKIGKNCVLHPNVFVEDNCTIGDNVILHSGVIIGTDGFGYMRDQDKHIKFPQIGTVVIENDVEIGANSCVDRGALGETRIGEGTKIDNLVQIAHNVQIGKRVVIAALVGISGSSIIEDDCVIAGQVGIADHVTIQKGAIIGAKSAVFPNKIIRAGVWCGVPVQPLDDYKRQNAMLKGLSRLREEIKEIKYLAKTQKDNNL